MSSGTQVTVHAAQDSYRGSGELSDVRFLVGTAISMVLVVTAVYAVTMSSGPAPQALATMFAYP
jgi:hypothetical protein